MKIEMNQNNKIVEKNCKELPNNMEQYKIEKTPYYIPEKGTLDFALEQYLSALVYQAQMGEKYNPYTAIISLSAMDSQIQGDNLKNEENLISSLENRHDSVFQKQSLNNKEISFFHVQKNFSGQISKRLYINCKRENISVLTEAILKNIDDLEEYYLKFNSDSQSSQIERTEQIVIYVKDNKQFEDIVSRIQKTKQENPNLFDGAENVNPFMKNIDGYIAYTNDIPENAKYIELNDHVKYVSRSYNELLANALEDSFIAGIVKMIKDDSDLYKKFTDYTLEHSETIDKKLLSQLESPKLYVDSVLDIILDDDQKKIILFNNMKDRLRKITLKNPILEIKGIDDLKKLEICDKNKIHD